MATTKKADAVEEVIATDPLDELVEVFIDYEGEDESDVFVCINGQNWLIKRGEYVKVPMKVKLILDNSKKMKAVARERSRKLQNKQPK